MLNSKENKEADTISFEVRIPIKKTKSYYGMIQSEIDDFFIRKNQKYFLVCLYLQIMSTNRLKSLAVNVS